MDKTFQKGIQLLELGRYAAAREAFSQVLAEEPQFTPAMFLTAISYCAEEQFDRAHHVAQTAVATDPESDRNHYVLGLAEAGLENLDAAIACFHRALKLAPDDPQYYFQLGRVYVDKNIYGQAIEHLDKALALDPEYVEALAMRSHVDRLLSKKESAADFLEKAMRIDPVNAALQFQKGLQSEDADDFERAAERYQEVLRKDPGQSFVREKYLDAQLGKYPWYKWLVLRYRAFKQVNYLTIIFDILLVLVGGLALREKHVEEPHYEVARYLVWALLLWSFLFWVTRMLGHLYMGRKIWKLSGRDLWNEAFVIHLSVTVALVAFAYYTFSLNFLWMGTAIMLLILSLIILGAMTIEEPTRKRYARIYLWTIYGMGLVNFLANFFELSIAKFTTNLLLASTFGLFVLFAIYDSVKEEIQKWQSKKEESQTIKKAKRPLWENLLQVFFFVALIGLSITGQFYGGSILSFWRFIFCWLALSLIPVGLLYRYLKNQYPELLQLDSKDLTIDEVFSRLAGIFLSLIFVVFIIGILSTAFIPIGEGRVEQVAVMEHGLEQKKQRARIAIRYEGAKVFISPGRAECEAALGCDSVGVEVLPRLFGVEYVGRLVPCGEMGE
ncbi:MAG: tetratricopeptide repeat protein [Bacteroidota bacterium]